jgi:hypothetical protein
MLFNYPPFLEIGRWGVEIGVWARGGVPNMEAWEYGRIGNNIVLFPFLISRLFRLSYLVALHTAMLVV